MFAFVLHIEFSLLVLNVFFLRVCVSVRLFISYLDSFANNLTCCFLLRIHVVIRWQSEPKTAYISERMYKIYINTKNKEMYIRLYSINIWLFFIINNRIEND